MKKLRHSAILGALMLSLAMAGSPTALARTLTPAESLERARGEMPGLLSRSGQQELVYTNTPTSRSAAPAYYVFADPDNPSGGYLITTADTRLRAILGYADEGTFNPRSLPEALVGWLDNYEKEIEAYLALNPEEPIVSRAPGSELSALYAQWQPIAPMVVTKWGQGEPYYNHCPTYNGRHTLTGCVATAMAQILYYHKWSDCRGTAINRSTGTEITYVFDNHVFDWNHMTPTYSPASTAVEKDAVADLMFACGMAVNMSYGLNGSGAGLPTSGFIDYFGYDPSTQNYDRSDYSGVEWEKKIYDYLSSGRPIYYGGNYSIGHAFVLDGYDTNGYYHFNWGWDGDSDGFFSLSALNSNDDNYGGYSAGQDMTLLYKPTDTDKPSIEDREADYDIIIGSNIPAGTVLYVGDSPKVTFSMTNVGTTGFSSGFNVQVVNKQNGDRHQLGILAGMVDAGDCIEVGVPLALDRDPVPAGEYNLVVFPSWEPIYSQEVIVREGIGSLPTSKDIIIHSGRRFYGNNNSNYSDGFPQNVEYGTTLRFEPWFVNYGSSTKTISLVLNLYPEGSNEEIYSSNPSSINARPGNSVYGQIRYANLPLGVWDAKFVDESAGEVLSETWRMTVSKNVSVGDATLKVSSIGGRTAVIGVDSPVASIDFGNSNELIQAIGRQAFERDMTLTSVVIPESVEEIRYNAFRMCGNLRSVTFEGEIPPFKQAEGIFYGINEDCVFYVPYSAYDTYFPLLSKFGRVETVDDAGKVGPVELTSDIAAPVRYAVVNYRGLSLDRGGIPAEMTLLAVGADGLPIVTDRVNADALWFFTSGDTNGSARFNNIGRQKGLQAVVAGETSFDMVETSEATPLFIKRNGINTAGYAISTIYPFEEQACLTAQGLTLTSGSKPTEDDWSSSTWLFVKIPDGATDAEIDALCRETYAAAHPDKLEALNEFMEEQRAALSTLYAVTPWTTEAYSQLAAALDDISYDSETMSIEVHDAVNEAKAAFTSAAISAVEVNIAGREIALRNVGLTTASMKNSYIGYRPSIDVNGSTITDALTSISRVDSNAKFRLTPIAGSKNAYRLVNTATGKYLAELPSADGSYLTFTDDESRAAKLAIGFFLGENAGMTLTSATNGKAISLSSDSDVPQPATASAVGATSTWLVIPPNQGALPPANTLPEVTTDPSRPIRYAIVNYRGKADTDWEDRYEDPSRMSMLSVGIDGRLTTTDSYTDNALWYFTPGSANDSFIFHNIGYDKTIKAETSSSASTYTMVSERDATALLIKPNHVNEKGLTITTEYPFTYRSCLDSQRFYDSSNNFGLSTGWRPSSNDWMGTTWIFVPIEDNLSEADILERCQLAYVANREDITAILRERIENVLSNIENLTPWSGEAFNDFKTAVEEIEITQITTNESFNATFDALLSKFAQETLQGVMDNIEGKTVALSNICCRINRNSFSYLGYAESLTFSLDNVTYTYTDVAATFDQVSEESELTFRRTNDNTDTFLIIHKKTGKYLANFPNSEEDPLTFTDNISNAAKFRININWSYDQTYYGLNFESIGSNNKAICICYDFNNSNPVYGIWKLDIGAMWRIALAGDSAGLPEVIDGVCDGSMPEETGRYDIFGRPVGPGHRGLTIIRMSDGTAKKVVL